MVWAVLPLKDLVLAKTRLSGVLAPHERRALAQAMVEDVLGALVQVDELAGVLLVSDDPAAELLAHRYAITSVEERELGCRGLNGAIDAATSYLAERGVDEILVLHGDIPLVRPADLRELLALFREPGTDLVIAPDLAGTGTNVMLFTVDPRPQFRYGPGSCQAHCEEARARGQRVRLHKRTGLGMDIDSPGDVLHLYHQLQGEGGDSHCARLLRGTDLAQRLSIMERAGIGLDAERGEHDAV